MSIYQELNKIDDTQSLLEWGHSGQGVLCRTLIQILGLIGVTVPDGDWVLHHKDGNHKNESLDNLVIMTRKDHSRLHDMFNKNHPEKQQPVDPTFDVYLLLDQYIQQHNDELQKYEIVTV